MNKQKKRFSRYLWTPVRLIMIDEETLMEKHSIRSRPFYFILFLVLFILGILGTAFAAFYYTPLKYALPGYGTNYKEAEVKLLKEKVNEMEYTIKNQNFYINRIRSLLSGQPLENLTDSVDLNNVVNEEFEPIQKVPEDNELRKRVQQNIDASVSQLADQSPPSSSPELGLDQDFFVPVFGKISKGYNASAEHYGTDILAPQNTAIKSVLSGVVIFSDWSRETGHTMFIQHSQGIISVYKHNSALLKKDGERVEAGEAIAIIGNTGEHSTGPHLHFELWHNGVPLNPEEYINFN